MVFRIWKDHTVRKMNRNVPLIKRDLILSNCFLSKVAIKYPRDGIKKRATTGIR
jgi:hypothetical protein